MSTDFTRIIYDETKMLCWGADRILAKLADYSQETACFFQKPIFIAGETCCPPSQKTNFNLKNIIQGAQK